MLPYRDRRGVPPSSPPYGPSVVRTGSSLHRSAGASDRPGWGVMDRPPEGWFAQLLERLSQLPAERSGRGSSCPALGSGRARETRGRRTSGPTRLPDNGPVHARSSLRSRGPPGLGASGRVGTTGAGSARDSLPPVRIPARRSARNRAPPGIPEPSAIGAYSRKKHKDNDLPDRFTPGTLLVPRRNGRAR